MHATFSSAPSAREALRRALSSTFCARDLAEPLVPLEASLPRTRARELLAGRRRVVGAVTDLGRWTGWLHPEDLDGEGVCGEVSRPFEEQPILPETAPVKEVVLALGSGSPVFIKVLGEVGAAVLPWDLQKAPMRMWLFGLVTMVEVLMSRMLERQLPGDQWRELLSEGRLEHARALQEERRRRREDATLLACLQFGDKADVLLKNDRCRELLGFESRRKGQEFFRRMEGLRNCLAHAQLLPVEDLEVLVTLAGGLDELLHIAEHPLPEATGA